MPVAAHLSQGDGMKRGDKLAAGKFDVDVPLVRRLIARQFPQWAGLAVTAVDEDGWDNWTFRLGERMKVRLPSDHGYAEQAAKEARFLPLLAPQLPVAVPVPLALGEPEAEYPWQWSVHGWIDGQTAGRTNVADRPQLARDVAAFLAALQRASTRNGPAPGPHNYQRGAAIMTAYGAQARLSVETLAARIDVSGAHAVLDAADAGMESAPCWVHGDVAIGNLLVRDGRLCAVIDFGCMAVGDPACDLVIAWLFFDGDSRAAFRQAILPADAGVWARARGWALWKAALVLANGSPTNPEENAPLAVIEAVIAEHRALRA